MTLVVTLYTWFNSEIARCTICVTCAFLQIADNWLLKSCKNCQFNYDTKWQSKKALSRAISTHLGVLREVLWAVSLGLRNRHKQHLTSQTKLWRGDINKSHQWHNLRVWCFCDVSQQIIPVLHDVIKSNKNNTPQSAGTSKWNVAQDHSSAVSNIASPHPFQGLQLSPL